ncbi:hypothetical protein N0V90_006741 [Kalmusia sp. IMI 367209]|nr:hypothetical protein N0V90_006741 [Kalmusia sp. IMI 367209]
MSSPTSVSLGWFGLGSMGLAIASNLQKHLKEKDLPALHFSNRNLSRGDPLKTLGGIPCQDINELVQVCDVIFISVTNDEVLTSIINQFISTSSLKNKILVDTTTVHPDTTSILAARLATHNCSFVAAPVFGAPPAARAAQILMAVAEPPEAIETITPYLKDVIARGVIHVGDDPSKALLLKTTSNFLTAGLMYLISEAHVLAEKASLPAAVLESLIEQNLGAYAHGVSRRLTSGAYFPAEGVAPNSALELGIKDVKHGLEVAKREKVKLAAGELALGAMEEAKVFGDEKGRALDSSGLFGIVRKRAGLEFESEVVKERDGLSNVEKK